MGQFYSSWADLIGPIITMDGLDSPRGHINREGKNPNPIFSFHFSLLLIFFRKIARGGAQGAVAIPVRLCPC